jgi:hypothetical protein
MVRQHQTRNLEISGSIASLTPSDAPIGASGNDDVRV